MLSVVRDRFPQLGAELSSDVHRDYRTDDDLRIEKVHDSRERRHVSLPVSTGFPMLRHDSFRVQHEPRFFGRTFSDADLGWVVKRPLPFAGRANREIDVPHKVFQGLRWESGS